MEIQQNICGGQEENISIYFLHFTSFYLDLLGILSDIIYGIPVGILSDCLSHSLPDIFFDIGMLCHVI